MHKSVLENMSRCTIAADSVQDFASPFLPRNNVLRMPGQCTVYFHQGVDSCVSCVYSIAVKDVAGKICKVRVEGLR